MKPRIPCPCIRSVFVKWVFFFTCIIIVTYATSLNLTAYYVIPKYIEQLDSRLYNKAETLKDLNDKNIILTKELLNLLKDSDIEIELIGFDNLSFESDFDLSSKINLDMLRLAQNGEIVKADFDTHRTFYILKANDSIAVVSPRNVLPELDYFKSAIKKGILSGTVLCSIMSLTFLSYFFRPIKKIISATKEISKGNLDIQVPNKSKDELGELTNNFNIMVRELNKNFYLRKNFVSDISHEFKTPITSIEGFANLLKTSNLTREQYNEYADTIIRETRRLSNLSSNLLKMSVLDSNEIPTEKNYFYLDEQIRHVILLLQKQWESKNLILDIDLEETRIFSSEELLSQVWINLLQNAIKYSNPNTKIFIFCKNTNDGVAVTFKDRGIGIPKQDVSKIFDKFYTVDRSRSKEGCGLGLAIVKRILEILDGSVECESKLGNGTKFTVKLKNIK